MYIYVLSFNPHLCKLSSMLASFNTLPHMIFQWDNGIVLMHFLTTFSSGTRHIVFSVRYGGTSFFKKSFPWKIGDKPFKESLLDKFYTGDL